jgi:hypothetical protein
MAIDKSKWNKDIKVSQKTIDEIKKMGMTKALKSASGSQSAEYKEALRRLYTPERVDKLIGSSSKSATSGPKSASTPAYGLRKPAGQYTKGPAKSGQAGSTTKPSMKPGDKKVAAAGGGKGYSYSTKVTKGKDSLSFGEGVGKAAKLAGTVLIAGRIPGAGRLAAKAMPAITSSGVGRAVFGSKAAAKATTNYIKKPGAVSASTMAKGIKETGDSVSVGAKGSFGKTTSATTASAAKKEAAKAAAAKAAAKAKREAAFQAKQKAAMARIKAERAAAAKAAAKKTAAKKPTSTPAKKAGKK